MNEKKNIGLKNTGRNEMITVEIKCSGYGASTWETVKLSRSDIERAAMIKLRETDASPNMQAIDVVIQPNADLSGGIPYAPNDCSAKHGGNDDE
jgi:hypothetical protein